MFIKIFQICLAGLFVVATEIQAAPDVIDVVCVDESDRSDIRLMISACDTNAINDGYNAGIFRPANPLEYGDGWGDPACQEGETPYLCLGTPGSSCPGFGRGYGYGYGYGHGCGGYPGYGFGDFPDRP